MLYIVLLIVCIHILNELLIVIFFSFHFNLVLVFFFIITVFFDLVSCQSLSFSYNMYILLFQLYFNMKMPFPCKVLFILFIKVLN